MVDITIGKKFKTILIILLALCGFNTAASANSYLEMITTPPLETNTNNDSTSYFNTTNESATVPTPLWYDTRITTAAPVVFSPLPKYIAWQQAKQRENTLQFDSHEFIQNLIYNLEGGLAIWGVYQFHKHH